MTDAQCSIQDCSYPASPWGRRFDIIFLCKHHKYLAEENGWHRTRVNYYWNMGSRYAR